MNKLVLKTCGKHYGHVAGECSKCKVSAKQSRNGLQYSGTPWNALFEPSEAMLEQDRRASLNRSGLYWIQ